VAAVLTTRQGDQIVLSKSNTTDAELSRLIDLFVDILPIDELGFKHVKLQSEGRPPYNPATLLKLYLYGYKHSIRSSRKLEHFL
uniref:transposase n=1 Tax=Bacteroides faecis TaxID=674529 RepID=UPI0032EDA78F